MHLLLFQHKQGDSELEEEVSKEADNIEESSDYNSPDDDDDDDEHEEDAEEEQQAARETFMSKDNTICWPSVAYQSAGRMAADSRIYKTGYFPCICYFVTFPVLLPSSHCKNRH